MRPHYSTATAVRGFGHEAEPDLANGRLWQRFGRAEFSVTDRQGIDDRIALMGPATGYASKRPLPRR